MEHLHVKYNGSVCVQYTISFGTFLHGTYGSVFLQNIYFITHLHVEHIVSVCLQNRTSFLAHSRITNKFVD